MVLLKDLKEILKLKDELDDKGINEPGFDENTSKVSEENVWKVKGRHNSSRKKPMVRDTGKE